MPELFEQIGRNGDAVVGMIDVRRSLISLPLSERLVLNAVGV